MNIQSEAILEENLLKQLQVNEYEPITIKDDKVLEQNLKVQLEKHNKTTISENEFKKILNHLSKGSIFEKAQTLRDRFSYSDDEGNTKYISFLDYKTWQNNIFQVTSQVTVEGRYENRYDVSILINGLPLVQIELKRSGLELKEAFNQIIRYKKHSYGSNSALFNYIQLFIISNDDETKYYANNKKIEELSYKQTFYWADENNKNITNLKEFTNIFLNKSFLLNMIAKYIVLAQEAKLLMALRPYQYYAVEAIVKQVSTTSKNGYIWHTTGSGKTLTSFKTAQILTALPLVDKVVFVVDRKDLDSQTTREFNSFSDGSVDGTDNTKTLVKQFSDDTKLIVTTIQKLNTAIKKKTYLEQMSKHKDKHIVFIFDECHRSQFGETHKKINEFFTNNQMIGFTGTPIFEDNASRNALGKRTTKELFDERLHTYVITDAINDENVLKFSIEYIGRYKEKQNSNTSIDIEVEDIDTKELLDSQERIDKISEYIIANHGRKTHGKEYTAMMAVSSVETLIKYYESFKSKNHNLKIATIFSYSANEEDKSAKGDMSFEEVDEVQIDEEHINKHSREKLDEFIEDYNKMFNTSYSTRDSKEFYNYYENIATRVKNKEIDILLVVNMFLTGFDSRPLNTLYVDKNLKYHGLIQAFSRTNRIEGDKKSQGNIVCFRNLKKDTDDAIALFSNTEAKEIILMEPYEEYLLKFDKKYEKLKALCESVEDIDELIDEEDKLEFVKAFRDLIRVKNVLESFSDFKWEDIELEEQEFERYKSKYTSIYDEMKRKGELKGEGGEKVSILEDVDFQLELIQTDKINVHYILNLLASYKDVEDEKEKQKQKENISNILNNNIVLRSKKELIEKFINESLGSLKKQEDIQEEFEKFWDVEKNLAFDSLCEEENLKEEELQKVVDTYVYDHRKPLSTQITNTLKDKPKLLERKKIVPRIIDKLVSHVEKFYDGIFFGNKKEESAEVYEALPQELLAAQPKAQYNKV